MGQTTRQSGFAFFHSDFIAHGGFETVRNIVTRLFFPALCGIIVLKNIGLRVSKLKIDSKQSKIVWFLLLTGVLSLSKALFAQTWVLQPQALDEAGIYALQMADPNLFGQSVRIDFISRSQTYQAGLPMDDYRLNTAHSCFIGRDIRYADSYSASIDQSNHSTAIGAILIGLDPAASSDTLGRFFYQGILPEARLEVHEFWRFIRDYIHGNQPLKTDLVTLSAGIPYEDWWTRGFDRLADRTGLIIVAAAGNGSSVYDPVLYPAAGANVIAVGVLTSTVGMDSRLSFGLPNPTDSSCGPTSDLRCKPDLVAPGNCLVPDLTALDTYRLTGDASSYATPIVAGVVGMLIQKARLTPELAIATEGPAANCILKAILLNSARKLPWWHKGSPDPADDASVPLDYLMGAGVVDAPAAWRQLLAARHSAGIVPSAGWNRSQIANVSSALDSYRFQVQFPDEQITATLAWNRHYSDEYPYRSLSAANVDLRLELWAIDPDHPSRDYRLAVSDSPNDNLEHIFVGADPRFEWYDLRVTLGEKAVPDLTPPTAVETYGLAWRTTLASDWIDQPLWKDLNGDGSVTAVDSLVFSVVTRFPEILANESFRQNVLRIPDSRLPLLTLFKDTFSLAFGLPDR